MTSLTIEQHRGLVDDLLAGLRREGGRPEGQHLTDWLAIDSDSLSERPDDYRGRVLAEDLYATGPLPAFDNSQMDGYAVHSADLRGASAESPVTLTVAPRIVAGETGEALERGHATPIMTGAPIPAGADAVIPIERVDPPRFGDHERVRFTAEVRSGTFVRRAGSDVADGELLLAAGTELSPAALGVIAHSGLGSVEVRSRPHVLLVPTGHEIRPPGWVLEPGQIYDANSFTLGLALQQAGCLVTITPCTSDDPEDFLAILRTHVEEVDLVLTIGGVSAGAREVVRESLTPLGARFHHVAMQPGGPQGLGLVDIALEDTAAPIAGPGAGLRDQQPSAPRVRRLPVLCFPGNPVSGLVSFEMFLRPFLLAAGGREGSRSSQRVPLADAVDSPPGKHQVRRGVLTLDGTALPVGGASSHLLHSYALSSILIHIPAEATHLDAGEPVEVWTIS